MRTPEAPSPHARFRLLPRPTRWRVDLFAALASTPSRWSTATRHGWSGVLRNLVDNAERHAVSRVTITLTEADGQAVLTVRDDDPGIPAEHCEPEG